MEGAKGVALRRAINLSRKSRGDLSNATFNSTSPGAGGGTTFRASSEALALFILSLRSAGG